MSLDAIWQAHRPFILGVAGGVAVFLAGEALVRGTAGARLRAAEVRIRSAEQKLRTPRHGAAAVSQLERRLADLRQRAADLERLCLPPRREEFRPQEGQSPSEHYIQFTSQRRQELLALALSRNVDVDDSLGLPPVSPTEPQAIERVLRGFDAVDRVVRLAVAAGAREVAKAEIEVRPLRKAGRGAAAPLLDTTPVRVEVVLPEERTAAFLQALASRDAALPLERAELAAPDVRQKGRRVLLEFAVGEVAPSSARESAAAGRAPARGAAAR